MVRRLVLALALFPMAMPPNAAGEEPARPQLQIDHVILGIGDLERGIEQFQQLTGVRPVVGGEHPGRGTRNALAALGGGRYLEILTAQGGAPPSADIDALRKLEALTPIGWAVSTSDVEATRRLLTQAGYGVSNPTPGSRVKPDGTTLEWTTFRLTSPELAGAPFFIRWSPVSAHPSSDSPGGCTLTGMTLVTTDGNPTRRLLDVLAVGVETKTGDGARLDIALRCPKGAVTLPARKAGEARLVPLHPLTADVEVIQGDPEVTGQPFVMRIRELPGTIIPPHTHPVDENITVLQGTFLFAVADTFDLSLLKELKAGGYAFAPRGSTMFGASPDGAIVQVHGVGPFHIHWRDGFKTLDDTGAGDVFHFRKGDVVTTPRGTGKVRQGYASGAHIQYEVEQAGGALFMALQSETRKAGAQ